MLFLGHRGASSVAPENTLAAFRVAAARCDGFELDCQLLRDGAIVALHDTRLWRTGRFFRLEGATKRTWVDRARVALSPVGRLVSADLEGVDVGAWFGVGTSSQSWSEKVPPLEEALRVARDYEKICFAELKETNGNGAQLAEAAAGASARCGLRPDLLYWISFDAAVLSLMKRRTKNKCLYVAEVADEGQAMDVAREAHALGFDGVDLNAGPHVTRSLTVWLAARAMCCAVWVYKAPERKNDNAALWEAMEANGVDVFTSNLPEDLGAWLESRRGRVHHLPGAASVTGDSEEEEGRKEGRKEGGPPLLPAAEP